MKSDIRSKNFILKFLIFEFLFTLILIYAVDWLFHGLSNAYIRLQFNFMVIIERILITLLVTLWALIFIRIIGRKKTRI